MLLPGELIVKHQAKNLACLDLVNSHTVHEDNWFRQWFSPRPLAREVVSLVFSVEKRSPFDPVSCISSSRAARSFPLMKTILSSTKMKDLTGGLTQLLMLFKEQDGADP